MRIFIIILFILNSCSMLPPTKNEFENTLSIRIGKNINDRDIWGLGHLAKIVRKASTKERFYEYHKNRCRYVYITDLDDYIIGYKILTRDNCKSGIARP
jgi:hypothetical protein